jgi:uncharacterized protein YndB with AHSA1/START domain
MTDHADQRPRRAVAHRFEHVLEVPATPEQVWAAIATAQGTSSWMVPTEMDEHEGGAVAFHMGPGASSHGRITAYEPHRRIAYDEDWATLAGQSGADVTPMATEFLIEARSGGSCVVRIVSSAFGTGADWENEFWADMEGGWRSMLDNLGSYLTHFPGRPATPLDASAELSGEPSDVMVALCRALGRDGGRGTEPATMAEPGSSVEVLGLRGRVERATDNHLVAIISEPVEAMLAFYLWPSGPQVVQVSLLGYVYSPEVAGFVEREQPRWTHWLASLGSAAAQRPGG